jgi:hypothetical protein
MNQKCKFNKQTNVPYDIQEIPDRYYHDGAISNPSCSLLPQMVEDGWRAYVPSDVKNIKNSHWVDDGKAVTLVVDEIYTQEELDKQQADIQTAVAQAEAAVLEAKQTVKEQEFATMIVDALTFRTLLRKVYPHNPTPETDTSITYESLVKDLFTIGNHPDTPITMKVDTLIAGLALKECFTKLATWNLKWNGGQLLETWTLPWKLLPTDEKPLPEG